MFAEVEVLADDLFQVMIEEGEKAMLSIFRRGRYCFYMALALLG
jgi:hypothetical protein